MSTDTVYVRDLADLGRRDGGVVGGKNASLGEMIGGPARGGRPRACGLRDDSRGLLALHR